MSPGLLIVGTGRSGTGYVAATLRAAGVDCGHEAVYGPPQAVGANPPLWRHHRADASWLAVPVLDDHPGPVALALRHPLRVVDSLDRLNLFAWEREPHRRNAYRAAVAGWAPQVFAHDDPIVRAAHFAASWPRLTRTPDLVFNVEDFDAATLRRLAELAGVAISVDAAAAALEATPTDVNAARADGERRTADEVAAHLIRAAPSPVLALLADTYGDAYPAAAAGL